MGVRPGRALTPAAPDLVLLVVTASREESAAVVAGLPQPPLGGRIGPYPVLQCGDVVVVAGPGGGNALGPAAAAAAAATVLALGPGDGLRFGAVASAGIAGGFGLPIGQVVLADRIVFADLGTGSPTGWQSMAELGWAQDSDVPGAAAVSAEIARLGAPGTGPTVGTVLTLAAMTGTAARAAELRARHPDAVAEAMEGAGVAAAGRAHGVPVWEVRSVSNPVGDRDRAAWDVPAALAALTGVAAPLCTALLARSRP